ncbi:uncharacterized protein [Amphiura filiformis]|uniref:uncharacterized protein n=1 Tax=Amphiura filiformis TaxID=82378 RepID=UPI003B21EDED
MDEITGEPKKRKKRRRLKLKKLNPFKKKYKKFSEDDFNWNETEDGFKKSKKKKSRVRNFLNQAARVITFRSRRKRSSSLPISTRLRSRSKYSSTGSLECLVTSDKEFQTDIKGMKRSYSDSCLYQMAKDANRKKKKTTKKRVKKASVRAAKYFGTGMVHAAGMFQYMSPIAGIPTAVGTATRPKPKSTYQNYGDTRRKHRDYSNMQYAFSS